MIKEDILEGNLPKKYLKSINNLIKKAKTKLDIELEFSQDYSEDFIYTEIKIKGGYTIFSKKTHEFHAWEDSCVFEDEDEFPEKELYNLLLKYKPIECKALQKIVGDDRVAVFMSYRGDESGVKYPWLCVGL